MNVSWTINGHANSGVDIAAAVSADLTAIAGAEGSRWSSDEPALLLPVTRGSALTLPFAHAEHGLTAPPAGQR